MFTYLFPFTCHHVITRCLFIFQKSIYISLDIFVPNIFWTYISRKWLLYVNISVNELQYYRMRIRQPVQTFASCQHPLRDVCLYRPDSFITNIDTSAILKWDYTFSTRARVVQLTFRHQIFSSPQRCVYTFTKVTFVFTSRKVDTQHHNRPAIHAA